MEWVTDRYYLQKKFARLIFGLTFHLTSDKNLNVRHFAENIANVSLRLQNTFSTETTIMIVLPQPRGSMIH